MEKLIHKATGELILDNPFRAVGTKLRYVRSDGYVRVGIITESALACVEHAHQIWAAWFDERDGGIPSDLDLINKKNPTYLSSYEYKVEILEAL